MRRVLKCLAAALSGFVLGACALVVAQDDHASLDVKDPRFAEKLVQRYERLAAKP